MQKYSFLCFLQSIFCNFIKLFLSRYITGLAMVIGLVLLLSGIFHHFIVAFLLSALYWHGLVNVHMIVFNKYCDVFVNFPACY